MTRSQLLAAAAALCLTAAVTAGDVTVGTARFPGSTEINVNGKTVMLSRTGAAMRQKFFLSVYAIASYSESGVNVRSAEELAGADVPKQLQLVMQRDVAGRDVAESFRSAIRANHPKPAFNAEVDALVRMLEEGTARSGEVILLTHLPGIGLRVTVMGKEPFVIKNPGFSKAVWDIYLGYYNVGDAVKKGLVSEL